MPCATMTATLSRAAVSAGVEAGRPESATAVTGRSLRSALETGGAPGGEDAAAGPAPDADVIVIPPMVF